MVKEINWEFRGWILIACLIMGALTVAVVGRRYFLDERENLKAQAIHSILNGLRPNLEVMGRCAFGGCFDDLAVRPDSKHEVYYQRMTELLPTSFEGHFLLGYVREIRGNVLGSNQEYKEALKYNDHCLACLFNLGRQYLIIGQYAEAEKFLIKASRISFKDDLEEIFTLAPFAQILGVCFKDPAKLQKNLLWLAQEKELELWRMAVAATYLARDFDNFQEVTALWLVSRGGGEAAFWAGVASFERSNYPEAMSLFTLSQKSLAEGKRNNRLGSLYLDYCRSGKESTQRKESLRQETQEFAKLSAKVFPYMF